MKKKLQTWLISTGNTRKQLAELLNVSPRTVDAWLANKSRPIPAKMYKPIEELIAPKIASRELTDTEKEFYALPNKRTREIWLQDKIEKILALSHRLMTYWEINYSVSKNDTEFYEDLTDMTHQIKKISDDVTMMGGHHADCILFEEYDDVGNYVLKK